LAFAEVAFFLDIMALVNNVRLLSRFPVSIRVVSQRTMASNRNHTVGGVSNETNLTEEVRDLVRNARHAENVDEWKRGHLVDEKITVKTFRPNREADIDDDQGFDIEYYPHAGEKEEWAKKGKFEPPLVLLAERIAKETGEPYWFKEALEKLGLGKGSWIGKRVAVPNMTHYTSLLYQVKHLVRITPVSFPHGIPKAEEFDAIMARVSDNGEFLYHPKIKDLSERIEKGQEKGEKMLIQTDTYKKKAAYEWRRSGGSPMGNANYNRNTTILNPKLSNRVTDSAHKVKY